MAHFFLKKQENTVRLTYWLFWLDSAALLVLNEQYIYLFGQIRTRQTGGQPYNDTSPYGECSLGKHPPTFHMFRF